MLSLKADGLIELKNQHHCSTLNSSMSDKERNVPELYSNEEHRLPGEQNDDFQIRRELADLAVKLEETRDPIERLHISLQMDEVAGLTPIKISESVQEPIKDRRRHRSILS
jgi:uncharacterized protein (UPF0216 family)